MRNENKLPVCTPIIETYNIYGTVFSIISDIEEIWPWVYTNFIQIRYVREWDAFFFDNHHLIFDHCPWMEHYRFPRYSIAKMASLKDFIKEAIDEGSYVYLYLDYYYMPLSKAYKQRHYMHEIMVYGYDLNNNQVYIADNLDEGKYIHTVCSLSILEQAYWEVQSENEFFTSVHLFRKRQESFFFKPGQVLNTLQNYLSSQRSIDMSYNVHSIFGMNALQLLLDTVEERRSSLLPLDIRAFHLIWEHKKLMQLRVAYLLSHYKMRNSGILDQVNSLESEAVILRNQVVKYNFQRNGEKLISIGNRFQSMIINEKNVISEICDSLGDLHEVLTQEN